MKLVIVESPAKCKKIEGFLGPGYRVTASFGHIRDLDKGLQAIDIENGFTAKYIITKRKVVADLRKMAKAADEVIIASDLDREGEAIGFHIAAVLGLDPKTTKRLVFNQITQSAIQKALKNPRTLDYNLFNAQQARRILDRLVGFELSPLLWRHIKTALSAGRCQSPAVKLVADREEKIAQFASQSYFDTRGVFVAPSIELEGVFETRYPSKKTARHLLQECQVANLKISHFTKKEATHKPPPPFTTSSLQQEASSKLSISPKFCMGVAQKLYEMGKITYMRTDSVELSPEAMVNIANYVQKKYGKTAHQKRRYTTKNQASQEAHEAIRPVYIEEESLENCTDLETRLYRLIHQRTVASQMKTSTSNVFRIKIDLSNRDDLIECKIERVTRVGYLLVYGIKLPPPDARLANIAIGQKLTYTTITSTQKFTTPLARYTEASLVKSLEKKGIGRPSTFSSLISTIQDRGYVLQDSREGQTKKTVTLSVVVDKKGVLETEGVTQLGCVKKKLFMTDIGIMVNQFLQTHFTSIMDYNFTSTIEKKLDRIAKGELLWNDVVGEVYADFHPIVTELSKKGLKREKHKHKRSLGTSSEGLEVTAYLGKYGPVVQLGNFEEHTKNRFAGVPKELSIKEITIEQALGLLAYPQKLGKKEGTLVTIKQGDYGLYLNWGQVNVSLSSLTSVEIKELDLASAEKLLEGQEKNIIRTFSKTLSIRRGKYGPYIKSGKRNVSIPKSSNPEEITLAQCKELLKAPKKRLKKKKT